MARQSVAREPEAGEQACAGGFWLGWRRGLSGFSRTLRALRQDPAPLVTAAYYAVAGVLLAWGVLVMLRGALPDHADGLWVLSFAHDIWHGLPLHGWQLPGAPLYFPELTTVLVSSGLGFGVRSTLLIYGLLTWFTLGAGVYAGLRVRGIERPRALQSAFITLFLYLLLHCGSSFLQTFEFPFSHGGSVLVAFIGVIYLGRGLERGFGRVGSLVFASCVALSCASDRAVLAQFVVPVLGVLALLLLSRTGPRARLWWALGLVVVAAAAGGVLTLLIHWRSKLGPGAVHPHLNVAASLATLRRVCDDFEALTSDRPYFGVSMLLPALLLGWRVLGEVGTRWFAPSKAQAGPGGVSASLPADVWFAATGLAALTGTLAAVVVSNVWSQRYVLPVYVLPLAFGVVVGVPRRPIVPRAWFRGFELGTLFVGVLIARHTDRHTLHPKASLQSSTRACLDHYFAEQGLNAGYAGYWQSRPQMLLGHTPVTLAQVHGRLQPHGWASNTYWRTRGYRPELGPPRFSFAINPGLDEHWMEERFGAPRARHSCFGQELWVYDRPQDVEFRNYVRSESALETGDQDHWWLVQGSEQARARGADELASESAAGVVVELPHVHANVIELVSPTRKALELGYGRGGTELATQEVTFQNDTRRLLAIPAGVDAASLDTLVIRSKSDAKFHIRRIALMWDPDAEQTRR